MASAARLLLDDFVAPADLREILDKWPKDSPAWKKHDHESVGNKRAMGKLVHIPAKARALLLRLNEQAMIDRFSEHFGYDLIPDPWIVTQGQLFGGGLHEIGADGFLGMHVDYNWHAGVYRRLNLLLYLNDWKPGDGGELVLGEEVIEPLFNRAVVFETTENSWHGHPNPWKGKESRKSLAVYYYSGHGEAVEPHTTIYRT